MADPNRKAVRIFMVYRGRMTRPIGVYLRRKDAASFAFWWIRGRVETVEIRPVAAKKRSKKR